METITITVSKKFKMTKEEMLHFNDECDSVARLCPQYRGEDTAHDRDILLGNIKPKDLVKRWLKSDVLWRSGYYVELGEDAIDVFHQYRTWKAQKKVLKAQKAKSSQERRV